MKTLKIEFDKRSNNKALKTINGVNASKWINENCILISKNFARKMLHKESGTIFGIRGNIVIINNED